MAGVSDEALLALGGVLLSFEHGVERPAETGDLVLVVARDVEPQPGRTARDALGLRAVPLDWVQCAASQAVADKGGQREGGEVGHDELGEELAQRLVALIEPHGAHRDPHAALRRPSDGERQDADATLAVGEQVAARRVDRPTQGLAGLRGRQQRQPRCQRRPRCNDPARRVEELGVATLRAG